ncbi:MAG: hypothetical protein DRP93_06940 [Candidatus Neomarinimicrobiota bacterium]|nr:MAG: hypothetical protein DRP93_06940 [Candidatus Neomarinimicrobiota bacterium]
MSFKSIKNLPALIGYLETKYGADKAKLILSNEYNYNGPMDTQPTQAAKQAGYWEMKQLDKLRAIYKSALSMYRTMDKRTTEAKDAKANLLRLAAKGIAFKLQYNIQGA